MDMQMPSMDGLEATRRLRADQLLATIPVIAFTAMAMPNDQARGTAAGVDAYLSKPVSLSHLQSTIERFLSVPEHSA
jgi:CheY-like chemotaxis protein